MPSGLQALFRRMPRQTRACWPPMYSLSCCGEDLWRSAQQPRQAAVLEHAPARLAARAVGDHVVLEVHRAQLLAAARTGLALVPVHAQGHGQLVGNRQLHDLLVVVQRSVERRPDRGLEAATLAEVEIRTALVRREARLPQDLVDPRAPDARDRMLV